MVNSFWKTITESTEVTQDQTNFSEEKVSKCNIIENFKLKTLHECFEDSIMEMEMVFNGYSLTGFSITIYNIIIINTKILMYNKWHKNYLINIYVYINEYQCVILS